MTDLFGMETMTPKQQLRHTAEHYGALEEYEDWLTVLKKKKVASTPTAWKRRHKKVLDLIESGQNIVDVFAQSADSGWTGLFPVHESQQLQIVPQDEFGCMRVAKEHGIKTRPGESLKDFRSRIMEAVR
jgi:hypothetical protein